MRSKVVTIDRHIIDQERTYPDASGRFSALLYDIALAAKIISREVNMAGLIDVLGMTGETNVQGEEVRKLDAFAQEVMVKAMDHAGHLCCMVSEECEDVIPIPKRFDIGNYVLLFDPLDGSSNIDVNVSIGTIFSIHHRVLDGRSKRSGPGTMAAFGGVSGGGGGGLKSRYIGSLVSDFHRTLLQGGIFMYPPESKAPRGKLRILYEAAPLALVCEAAGGRASNGSRDILDIVPSGLHDRTPLFVGSASLIDLAEQYLRLPAEPPRQGSES